MKSISTFVIVILFATFYTNNVSAQVAFTNNEVQFNTDNPGLVSQDFSAGNITPGNFESCDVPVDENSNDICFTPGQILPGIQFQNGPVPFDEFIILGGPNILGNNNPVNVLATEAGSESSEVIFTNDNVKAVGMKIGCLFDTAEPCDTVLEIRVFGPGGTDLGVTDQFNSFIGIESTEFITRISLSNLEELNFKGIAEIRFPAETVVANVPTISQWGYNYGWYLRNNWVYHGY